MKARSTTPLDLAGSAYRRGQAQAELCPDKAEAVRAAVRGRLAPLVGHLARPEVGGWLAAQKAYADTVAGDDLDELRGIADGFGLGFDELFAYLHLGTLNDMAVLAAGETDGCTAWASRHPRHRAILCKNRDFRGEHVGLQRVFRHTDPAWGGRRNLCVGSLGSPGAYSSGINSDGLAVADTAIGTTDHGVGLLRYFVMTRLLVGTSTVAGALDKLGTLDHAGGGSIVLADATGAVAAVELGYRRLGAEKGKAGWVARTNHFVSPGLAEAFLPAPGDPMAVSSVGRLATVRAGVAAWATGGNIDAAAQLMASHDRGATGDIGLCRHGQDGDASTISTAIFACDAPTLYFCPGNPCDREWLSYAP